MRTLNAQEMDAASGGIAPIVGLILAVGGTFIRHAATAKAFNYAGVGFALGGAGVFAYQRWFGNGGASSGNNCSPGGQ